MSLKVLTRWQSEQASATHEGAWHLVVGGAEYGLLLYWCSYYHNLLLLLLPSALLNNNEKTNKLGIYYSSHSLFVLKFAKSTSDEFRGSSGGGSFQIHLNNKRCILCILRSKYDPDMLGLCPGTESWIRRDYCLREPRRWENIKGWWMGTEGGVWLSCCPFSESERNEKLAQGLSHSWFKLKLLQRRDGEARRESLVWSLTRLWPVVRGGPSEPLRSITMINPSTSAEPVRRKIAFCQSRFNLRWTVESADRSASCRSQWRHFNQNENFVVAISFIFAVKLQHWQTTNVNE